MRTYPGLPALSAALAGLIFIAGCNKPPEATGTPPPGTTVGTEIDDSVVTGRVKSALLADPDVKSFDFKVETRKGEVQLSGFADNQAQIDRATAVTRAVAGVTTIENNVSLKGAATTVGNKLDDGIVTTQVRAALLADASVRSSDIAVVTRKGEVQLSGFVDNLTQIDRAIEITRAVAGVKSVENNVNVKGAATTVGNKVDDGIVTAKVKAALLANASVKSSDIAVLTRKGAVQLSGFVDNQSQIDRAIEVAHGIEGVRSVSNEMSIKK